jgi:hypothetical protein
VVPVLDGILASPFARGAVSGVGVITLVAGLAEIGAAFAARRQDHDHAASHGSSLPCDRS